MLHQIAPKFTLNNQEGNEVSLSDYLGNKVVLYFYPKDNTPACTAQACAFRDNYQIYHDHNIAIIGISTDNIASHQKFSNKYKLPFPLLADPTRKTIEAYDVWKEKKLYGRIYEGIVRTTFVIDEQGIIIAMYSKVKPQDNATQILSDLGVL